MKPRAQNCHSLVSPVEMGSLSLSLSLSLASQPACGTSPSAARDHTGTSEDLLRTDSAKSCEHIEKWRQGKSKCANAAGATPIAGPRHPWNMLTRQEGDILGRSTAGDTGSKQFLTRLVKFKMFLV